MRQLEWKRDKYEMLISARDGLFRYKVFMRNGGVFANGFFMGRPLFGKHYLGTFSDARRACQRRHNTNINKMAAMLRNAGYKVEEPE